MAGDKNIRPQLLQLPDVGYGRRSMAFAGHGRQAVHKKVPAKNNALLWQMDYHIGFRMARAQLNDAEFPFIPVYG